MSRARVELHSARSGGAGSVIFRVGKPFAVIAFDAAGCVARQDFSTEAAARRHARAAAREIRCDVEERYGAAAQKVGRPSRGWR